MAYIPKATLVETTDTDWVDLTDSGETALHTHAGGGGAPTDADYLVGTVNGSLSAEIVVGTSPGGELGGTWASPTVDTVHSGSAHHAESHTIASHSDTTATGAELEELTDGSETTLHSHAGGGSGQLSISFHARADGHSVLTNQSTVTQFLENSNRNITKADLTNYTQVRMLARVVTGSASANTPRLIAQFSTSFSTSIGSYSDIGTSAVTCSLTSTGLIDSGWVNLAVAAKADVFITVLMAGGDNTADPAIGILQVQFK